MPTNDRPLILVGETNTAVASTLRKFLEGAGYEVQAATTPDAAISDARAHQPDVFVADVAAFDGIGICDEIKQAAPQSPVVLVFPPDDPAPEARAAAAGADAYLIGPLTRAHVLSCVKGMLRVRDLTTQVSTLEKELEVREAERGAASSPTPDYDFAKRVLLTEMRRSRRYKYPVSFVLATVDRFRDLTDGMDARTAGRFIADILGVVTRAARDVDLPMLFAEDRFLVFLPHTAAKGAMRVANRIVERVSKRQSEPAATVSVGVSVYEGSGKASFGSLLRDATDAARRAQIAGGNRVAIAEASLDDE